MDKVLTGYSRRLMAQNAPRNYRFSKSGRSVGRLLLCVLALGTLLASSAFPQVLEGTILLPDSLGPLTGLTHVALDESPGHPRMFIGSEDGNVLVMSTLTGERLARIQTDRVAGLCYSPRHNKLYVSVLAGYSVAVVDCSSYQVIKEIPFPADVNTLFYNPLVDRVYCGNWRMKVIDCATDSIVDSLMVNGRSAPFALDSVHNKLYVGSVDTFRVIDCNRDSVVASIYELRRAGAVCFQPSAEKVYVATEDALCAIDTESDTVVYRQKFAPLNPLLVCDPERKRVYYTYGGHAIALDSERDSVIWCQALWATAVGLAAEPEQDKLYLLLHGLGSGFPYVLDGATGQTLRAFNHTQDSSLYYSAAAKRVFLIWNGGEVTALDCRTDTVVGVTPLSPHVYSVCLDSANNKLYLGVGRSGVGIVDCSTNEVRSYDWRCGAPEYAPQRFAFNSRDERMYSSGDSSIFVFDCRADTMINEIQVGGHVRSMDWHPILNKLYVVTTGHDTLLVIIDCAGDTVTRVLDSLWWGDYSTTFVSPEVDQFWFVNGRYVVVDCLGDSIVSYRETGALSLKAACYDPSSRQVYAVSDYAMHVIDMDTRLPVDSLPIPHSANAGTRQVYCAPLVRKAYWTIMHGLPYDPDTVIVVDTRIDSIVSRFAVPFLSWGQCEDRTGDYVYFASEYLVAADARTDSVVSGVRVPLITRFLVRNSRTNRLYLAGLADSVIQVVYDSVVFAGLQAAPESPTRAVRLQTVLSRSGPLRSPTEAVLFDATGRRVVVLRPGPNDISRLTPGVYFLRERPPATSRKPPAPHKIVVAR